MSQCYTPPLYVIHLKGGLNSGEAQVRGMEIGPDVLRRGESGYIRVFRHAHGGLLRLDKLWKSGSDRSRGRSQSVR
jgi:hypothetical protein